MTQESKLHASGDWDQQANWANRGIPLWVRDDKVGSDALSLKEEETVQKGQAAEALAPAKRNSTGGEPAPKKKKTTPKLQAAKSVTGAESDESDEYEEEESKEEDEEEAQVSQGKAAKKVAAKPRSEETGARAPFKQPARQSQPRSGPQSHRLRVTRPLLRHWVLRCKMFRRKSNFFPCSDILCARARAMHSSSTTFMLSPCAAHFSL